MELVLVPGLWLDASSWDDVVPVLQEAGHRTHPLTLPGMESRDADRSGIGLRDHVDAVVAVIDRLEPGVVLVGHSGGGAVAWAAADARPDRVARVVFVDSWPTGAGRCINDGFTVVDGEVPLPDWSEFGEDELRDLGESGLAAFRERAIPSPAWVPSDPQELGDGRRYDVPVTIVACESPSAALRQWMEQGEPALAELALVRDVTWLDLPTGHWPQFTRPAELGRLVAAAAA